MSRSSNSWCVRRTVVSVSCYCLGMSFWVLPMMPSWNPVSSEESSLFAMVAWGSNWICSRSHFRCMKTHSWPMISLSSAWVRMTSPLALRVRVFLTRCEFHNMMQPPLTYATVRSITRLFTNSCLLLLADNQLPGTVGPKQYVRSGTYISRVNKSVPYIIAGTRLLAIHLLLQ